MHVATEYLFQAAKDLGYEPKIISDEFSYFTFTKNSELKHCSGFSVGLNTGIGSKMVKNKRFSNTVLAYHGLSVPQETGVGTDVITTSFKALKYFVKPAEGSLGKRAMAFGDWEAAHGYAQKIFQERGIEMVIQEMVEGKEYRVIILDGKIFAIEERGSTSVIGDGVKTIEELYKSIVAERASDRYMYDADIVLPFLEEKLIEDNLTLASIPPLNKLVTLAHAPNLYQGGYLQNSEITEVHKDIHELAKKIALAIPLRYMGLDIIISNGANQSLENQSYWILEINSAPSPMVHKFFEPNYAQRLLEQI
jgi:cyanophycin synthetase